MTEKGWKTDIRKACEEVGTYKECFFPMMDTLAWILAERDKAIQDYIKGGRERVIEHTNKNGSTNEAQNPILRLINDYNRDALSYWRELGLTPAGLKKLNEAAMKNEEKGSNLEKALAKLGGA